MCVNYNIAGFNSELKTLYNVKNNVEIEEKIYMIQK